MKKIWVVGISLVLASASIELVTPAFAGDEVSTPVVVPTAKEDGAIDCTKQVWPHFSPSCLRNADAKTSVRLISADRR